MELFANLIRLDAHAGEWAAAREAEGWDGVVCADHYWVQSEEPGRGSPHLWVTLGTMAAATARVTVASSFANNLLRSPVEFAQAALTLQRDSRGRAEAGLGAGWFADELTLTGQPFPEPPARARRYREALQIVRALLDEGRCDFEGEHYRVHVPRLGGPRPATPPPLVASVGGPWTIRHVTPLVDRVEVSIGRANWSGRSRGDVLATVTTDEVRGMVEAVREAAPAVPVGMLAFVAVGDGPEVRAQRDAMGDGLLAGFAGEPAAVAEALLALSELGVDRVQVTEVVKGSVERLAPALLG